MTEALRLIIWLMDRFMQCRQTLTVRRDGPPPFLGIVNCAACHAACGHARRWAEGEALAEIWRDAFGRASCYAGQMRELLFLAHVVCGALMLPAAARRSLFAAGVFALLAAHWLPPLTCCRMFCEGSQPDIALTLLPPPCQRDRSCERMECRHTA